MPVVRRRSIPVRTDDPLAAASSLDVLAACLRSGMAVSTAASATAPSAPAPLAAVLSRAADLLALGAEPSTAWTAVSASADKNVDALLRLARRSAASGAAMAKELPSWLTSHAMTQPPPRPLPRSGPRC